jgi:predicted TIM-barrel fold metal-dependent hydrolase
MIIDAHTHTPKYKGDIPEAEIQYNTAWRPDRPVKTPVNWAEYMKAMEPVDKAIVFGIARDAIAQEGEDSPNDATAEFVRAYPDKLIGFLSVHPRNPHCLEEMERCVSDLGLRGVKLGPNYQNFDPLGVDAFRVYARAQELRLPIVFHTGTSPVQMADLDYAHPRHFDRVAIAFPDLKMVLAHMAHPWQATTIAVIRKHPNVYADISALFYRPWSFYNCMRLAEEWGVLPKLLFGTDYLVSTPQENLDRLRNPNRILEGTHLPRISEAAMQEIIYRDSLTLLGLAD